VLDRVLPNLERAAVSPPTHGAHRGSGAARRDFAAIYARRASDSA
jgi:hypothetical protein